MKCPKCGYNSFEYNDTCTKCSNDMASYKATFGLKPIVMPLYARQNMAETLKTAEISAEETTATESTGDVFSFDLPDSKQHASNPKNDPFDFNDEDFTQKPESAFNSDIFNTSVKPLTDNQDFNTLLESTPQHHTSPVTTAETQPKNGEFDLSDFSWDEPPATAQTGEPVKPTDDFSSLFGDSKGTSK